MSDMATLNIRNVPEEVVETLKARAARKGDSLNAEVVRTLARAAGQRTIDEILDAIDEIQKGLPEPRPWKEFMDALHEEEDERSQHTWREATRPRLDE
jgi:plasmid stability protein